MARKPFFKKHRRLGLSLSGGAARGLAHIGVIKVLQEEEIPVSFISGTSVGSLIGAMFAAGLNWREMEEIVRSVTWKDIAQLTIPKLGIAKHERLAKLLDEILAGKTFEQLAVPFAAIAVDICTGEEIILNSGPVAKAVQASSSVPGIFEPTIIDGRYLVDGGLVNNLPVNIVKEMGATHVIAVDLNLNIYSLEPPKNILDILYRSYQIILAIRKRERKNADFFVAPNLEDYNYHDIKQLDDLMICGENAMRVHVKKLKKLF
ncbi:MAG: patatin-like phospholipase family protein [Spirochaetales bacterium]|nr:patatin-like phospholipase family protein [Spirochaetales bacterium]